MNFHHPVRSLLLVVGLITLSPVAATLSPVTPITHGTPYGRYLMQPAEQAGQSPGVCDPGLELILDEGVVLGHFALLRDQALGPCDMLVYPNERMYRLDTNQEPHLCDATLHGEHLHQGTHLTLTLTTVCAEDGTITSLTLIEETDEETRQWIRITESATIPWDETSAAIEPLDDEAAPLHPYPGADTPPSTKR